MEESLTHAIVNIAASLTEFGLIDIVPESTACDDRRVPTSSILSNDEGAAGNSSEQKYINLEAPTSLNNQQLLSDDIVGAYQNDKEPSILNIGENSENVSGLHALPSNQDVDSGGCADAGSSQSCLTKCLTSDQSDLDQPVKSEAKTKVSNAKSKCKKPKQTHGRRNGPNLRSRGSTVEKSANPPQISKRSQKVAETREGGKSKDSPRKRIRRPKTIENVKNVDQKRNKKQGNSEDVVIKTHKGDDGRLMYECNQCDYATPFKCTLQDHMRKHSGVKPYKCSVCDYASGYRQSLKDHMDTKHSLTPIMYKCQTCDYSAKSRSKISAHTLKVHDPSRQHQCPECPKSFLTGVSLRCHMAAQHGGDKFKCKLCDFECNGTTTLADHRRTVHQIVLYKCQECDYETKLKKNMKNHKKTHESKRHRCINCAEGASPSLRKFKCRFCDFRACTPLLLIKHVSVHYISTYWSVDKYRCTACDYATAFHIEMVKHLRYHNSKAPFVCPNCSIQLFSQKALVRHMNLCGPAAPGQAAKVQGTDYGCSLCNEEFLDGSQLKSHVLNKHNARRWICARCKYDTFQLDDFNYHIVEHSKLNECRWCSKSFANPQELSVHLKIDHLADEFHGICSIDSMRCPLCSALLTGTTAYRLHLTRFHPTEESAFCCILCAKSFGSIHNLRAHLSNSHSNELPANYKCSQCSFDTNSSSWMAVHISTHFDERLLVCCICEYSAKSARDLINHSYIHQDGAISCGRCSMRIADSESLITHRLNHGANLQCSLCAFNALDENDYREHVKSKHGGLFDPTVYFSCTLCSKSVADVKEIFCHAMSHTPGLTLNCSRCNFSSTRFPVLLSHFKSHKGTGRKVCDTCNESTIDSDSNDPGDVSAQPKLQPLNECSAYCIACGAFARNTTAFYQHFIQHLRLKPFSCSVCEFKTSDWAVISDHILQCVYIPPLKCQRCQEFFSTSAFKDHINQHEYDGDCHLCDAACKMTNTGYKEHMIAKHNGLRVRCSLCEFTTVDSYDSYLHYFNAHVQQPLFVCSICDLQCQDFEHLTCHEILSPTDPNDNLSLQTKSLENVQNKETRFLNSLCPECEFSSTDVDVFEQHISSHEVHHSAYVCSDCPYTSGQPHLLEKHKISQHFATNSVSALSQSQSEHPYNCSKCGHSTTALLELYSHFLIHVEKSSLSCVICGDSFAHLTAFGNHIIEAHILDVLQQHCFRCDCSFSDAQTLRDHNEVHVSKLQCLFCQDNMSSRDSLFQHLLSHQSCPSLGCVLCPYQATGRPTDMLQHIFSHHDLKPFQCQKCSFCGCDAQSIMYHLALCENNYALSDALMYSSLSPGFASSRPGFEVHKIIPANNPGPSPAVRNADIGVPCNRSQSPFKYYCYDCEIEKNSAVEMLLHLCDHYGHKPFWCPYTNCNFDCFDLSSLEDHFRIHKAMGCSRCGLQFSEARYMEDHQKRHSEALECYRCNYKADDRVKYDVHCKCHSEPTIIFYCKYCSYMNSSLGIFIKHFTEHVNLKLFCCIHCEFKTSSLSELQSHHAHCLVKPLPLLTCAKCFSCQFTSTENFENHCKSHKDGSDLFQKCLYWQWCQDSSGPHTFAAFNEHLYGTHRWVYHCMDCDQGFQMPKDFVLHRFSHSLTQEINCPVNGCDYKTTSPSHLFNHFVEFHPITNLRQGKFWPYHKRSSDVQLDDQSVSFPMDLFGQTAENIGLTLFHCHFCGNQTCDWKRFRAHMYLVHKAELTTIRALEFYQSKASISTQPLPLDCRGSHSWCNRECVYVCQDCERRFEHPHQLCIHRFDHANEENPFACQVTGCNVKLKDWNSYSVHSCMHWKSSCFRCSITEMGSQDWKCHMENHSTFNECMLCHYNALDLKDLEHHFCSEHCLVNLKQQCVYRCDTCLFSTAQKEPFVEHLARHIPLKLFYCPCGLSTNSLSEFHIHFVEPNISSNPSIPSQDGRFEQPRMRIVNCAVDERRCVQDSKRALKRILSSSETSSEDLTGRDTDDGYDDGKINVEVPPLTLVTRKKRKHLCTDCGIVVKDGRALEEHKCPSQLNCPSCKFSTDYPRALATHVSKFHSDLQLPTEEFINYQPTAASMDDQTSGFDQTQTPLKTDILDTVISESNNVDSCVSKSSVPLKALPASRKRVMPQSKDATEYDWDSSSSSNVDSLSEGSDLYGYSCEKLDCRFRCFGEVEMEAHLTEEHKLYQCDLCSYSSNFQTNMNSHYRQLPSHRANFTLGTPRHDVDHSRAPHENRHLDTPRNSNLKAISPDTMNSSTPAYTMNPIVLLHDIKSTGGVLEGGGDDMWVVVKCEPFSEEIGGDDGNIPEWNRGKEHRCPHCRYASASKKFVLQHIQHEHKDEN